MTVTPCSIVHADITEAAMPCTGRDAISIQNMRSRTNGRMLDNLAHAKLMVRTILLRQQPSRGRILGLWEAGPQVESSVTDRASFQIPSLRNAPVKLTYRALAHGKNEGGAVKIVSSSLAQNSEDASRAVHELDDGAKDRRCECASLPTPDGHHLNAWSPRMLPRDEVNGNRKSE
jgi:hypothetical protein